MREINEIASGNKEASTKKRENGNYFFIRITSKVGKIDRYNFVRVSWSDEKIATLLMAAKGKITRIANCNEGGVKRNYQKKSVEGERKKSWEKLREKKRKNGRRVTARTDKEDEKERKEAKRMELYYGKNMYEKKIKELE